MTNTVTFNQFDLSKIIHITDVERDVGNERSITTDDAPMIGVNVQEVKVGPKVIRVGFVLQGTNVETAKHELASVLNVDTPKKLTFTDEPDKYYLAIVRGGVSIKNVVKWFQKGSIEFLVPDGVAHSTAYRKFETVKMENNKLVIEVENKGTTPAYPIITLDHKATNGYIGLVNSVSAFELGNKEGYVTDPRLRSETLLKYRDNNITAGLAAGRRNQAILNDVSQSLDGTLGIVNVWDRPHIHLTGVGRGANNHAGSLTWDIPADSFGNRGSLNEYIWWRQIFRFGRYDQLGFIKVMVSDEQGRFLYGVESIKRETGAKCEFNFLVTNGQGGFKLVNQWEFEGEENPATNPFDPQRGWVDLERRDDIVRVFWFGGYPKFRVPEIAGKKSAKVHVALGAFGDREWPTHMYLDGIEYRKDMVSGNRAVPNRFSAGSTVVINSENDSVQVNGIDSVVDVVDGSNWLSIPPGKSTIELYLSSFAGEKPSVKVEFEERWI
ncbi:TPA: phage tail family protein [Streptococcus pyogenes]|jgi:putative phage tail component, N-terminal domain protein|uniref:distal tail protein Dit n=1 Tax=Streptococcus gordonii TaxID=1302 RepID=UPI00204F1BEB|nr:distal tail protein Dit [Streptococcus gordonii]DAK10751.1 MAG TPA: distal tail protein [Caudoviricetes sp.]HEP5937558.1 phage tail family protein [Streptococcus pyogenes]MCY7130083.1 phage tail family protein [Streptococcus gordonii]MCY7141857.1 phage tail family protein [Streptococcus gordonii]HEQ4682265.1 phage tail family protein [Streptococcus pyogenes]